jgi:hypothetical protein
MTELPLQRALGSSSLFQVLLYVGLEMLFANIRVGMCLLDKLIVGVPALVSGSLARTDGKTWEAAAV